MAVSDCSAGGGVCVLDLSDPHNGHAELSSYSSPVFLQDFGYCACCFRNDFSGVDIGNVQNDCSGVNDEVFLKLNSKSNAHVQAPSVGSFSVNACMFGVQCRIDDSSVPGYSGLCNNDGVCVVTLSDLQDGHVASCDSQNPFKFRVCCKPRVVPAGGCSNPNNWGLPSTGVVERTVKSVRIYYDRNVVPVLCCGSDNDCVGSQNTSTEWCDQNHCSPRNPDVYYDYGWKWNPYKQPFVSDSFGTGVAEGVMKFYGAICGLNPNNPDLPCPYPEFSQEWWNARSPNGYHCFEKRDLSSPGLYDHACCFNSSLGGDLYYSWCGIS